MSRFGSTVILSALLVGVLPPPKTALAFSTEAQAPGAIALDFDNADIAIVVQAVSEIVGFNYVLAPDVRGKVTVRTSGAMRREDVFPAFLSILEVNGFTAVRAGDVWKIVRIETARERAIPTFIEPSDVPTPPPPSGAQAPGPGPAPADQLVTHILVPRFVVSPSLAGVVQPLVSGRGSVIASPHGNVLILTDTATNVGRIVEVVQRLDVELATEEVHVIPLRFAEASYLADILNQLFADARLARPPIIVADRRTNSLVIRARRTDLDAIGRLLGRAD